MIFTRTLAVAMFLVTSLLASAQTYDSSIRGRSPQSKELSMQFRKMNKLAQQSKSYIDAGAYGLAQKCAEEGLLEHPEPILQLSLGEALLRQGKLTEALDVLKEANEVLHNATSYSRIGLILVRIGKISESRSMLKDELVSIYLPPEQMKYVPRVKDAKTLEGAWLYAIALEERMHGQDANEFYYSRQCLSVFPKNPLLNLQIGEYYLGHGQFDQAVVAFKIAATESSGGLKEEAERRIYDTAKAKISHK